MSLKPTARTGIGVLRLLIFGVMLALAVSIAFGWISAASGGTALGVALVGVLALILTRADFHGILARVQKVDAWGVSVDLKAVAEADEAVQGVKHEQASEAGEESGEEDEQPIDIIDLRLRLENSLVDIGQHVLPEEYGEFTSIGSLRAEKFLNEAQARTAARVLSF